MGHGFSCVMPLERERRRRGSSWKEAFGQRSDSYDNRRSNSGRHRRGSLKTQEQDLALQKQQQALAMMLLQEQLRFERSASVRASRNTNTTSSLPRSSSVRCRNANDPLLQPHELISKKEGCLKVETNHFLLVHGGGFGAWCWYKLIASLEGAGFVADAIDLAGSGIDQTDPNCITNLNIYTKPLINWLDALEESKKVILVGHDIGGACISYVMEMFPKKIAKSIFVGATMIADGQRAFDAFAPEDDLLSRAQLFNYAKDSQSPTSIVLNKDYLKDFFFNQTPTKDCVLAMVSIRPIPFAPVMERVFLSSQGYGSIPRFYILTTEDKALTPSVQENLVKRNPPNRVFKLKGSDHAPFFSRPQALFKILLEILQLDDKTELAES